MSDLLRAEVILKLAKAREFYDLAELAEGSYVNGSVSLAISSAINSSDILFILQTGAFPSGSSHDEAVNGLRRLGFTQASRNLQRILALKNKAQYQVVSCSSSDNSNALKYAARVLQEATSAIAARGFLGE